MTSWSTISSLILRRWLNVCFSSVFKSTWVDYRLRTEFWSSVGLLMLSHFRHSARKFFFQGLKEFAALKLLAQLLHCGLQQLMMQEMKIQNKEEQKIKTTTMKWKWSKNSSFISLKILCFLLLFKAQGQQKIVKIDLWDYSKDFFHSLWRLGWVEFFRLASRLDIRCTIFFCTRFW